DRDSVVGEQALEIVELALVLQHGELAVGAAGVISGTEFHGIDVIAFHLLENVFSGQLRQQRSEYADSHGDSPLCMGSEPTTEYHAEAASPQRRKDAELSAEKPKKRLTGGGSRPPVTVCGGR